MDTKWKNIKNVLSFTVFFLGVSLTLWNTSGLLQRMPNEMSLWTSGELFDNDYQQSWSFQNYISNRLEDFLSIAVNGCPGGWNYYDYYYNVGECTSDAIGEEEVILQRGIEVSEYSNVYEDFEVWEGNDWDGEWYYQWEDGYDDWGDWYDWYNGDIPKEPESMTEEQRQRLEQLEQRKEKIVAKYFAAIEGNLNLLYSISYDGELLYSNFDFPEADGSLQAPEGYNFLLYFDGEKVRIVKDGKEIDIYGDGYYRDDGRDWYVPGYRNFPVSGDMKNAIICMAAAEEPVLYTTGMDRNGGYRQQGNSLYWMRYNSMMEGKLLRWNMLWLAVGLALLFFSCFCRQGIREFAGGIARIQGKIWVECKVLLLLGILYLAIREYFASGYGYNIWWELAYAYDNNIVWAAKELGGMLLSFLGDLSSFWVGLFWVIYFTINDLKHNKKIWSHGVIAKCCRVASAKELKLTLSRRMAHRNAVLFAAIIVSGVVLLAGSASYVNEYRLWRYQGYNIWKIFLLCILVCSCLLLVVYLVSVKNMRAARDLEELSERIREICKGNYSGIYGGGTSEGNYSEPVTGSIDISSQNAAAKAGNIFGGGEAQCSDGTLERDNSGYFSGSELSGTLAQLENIRQGMANAVDEQMKSERMKVELIANVSHDLKTPLTSIISYVQFLKEEEGLPEHIQDYVKILDEKSQRLKNMVQDVFAVSKAASGELPMNMEKLDFGKLLRQTMADMDEEIQNSRVSFRTELPDDPVMIVADGQRMYRVFQNLFQNALKYSLDGSRVYVTLKADGNLAVASVKNTSHMELDEDTNFTERFVRGDRSRTDGGSGLGLSIAQSFTEACGGQFELEFNADLFIVSIFFQIAAESGEES